MKLISSKTQRLFSPATRNRVCATAFLGAYLLGAIGFPVEMPTQIDASTPFPCQDHRCGCRSAEQCWRQCCCFTRDEKLAWAKAHRVRVPEHLMPTLVAAASGDENGHAHEHGEHRSCGHDHHSVRNHAHASNAPKRCGTGACAPKNSSSCPPTEIASKCGGCGKQPTSKHNSSIVVIEALKCQGLATYWCSAGAVVPPPPILTWQFDWTCLGQVVCEPLRPLLLGDAPPVPPPRA